MVCVAQLVRVVVCGSIGRGFESHRVPKTKKQNISQKYSVFLFHKTVGEIYLKVFNTLKLFLLVIGREGVLLLRICFYRLLLVAALLSDFSLRRGL